MLDGPASVFLQMAEYKESTRCGSFMTLSSSLGQILLQLHTGIRYILHASSRPCKLYLLFGSFCWCSPFIFICLCSNYDNLLMWFRHSVLDKTWKEYWIGGVLIQNSHAFDIIHTVRTLPPFVCPICKLVVYLMNCFDIGTACFSIYTTYIEWQNPVRFSLL